MEVLGTSKVGACIESSPDEKPDADTLLILTLYCPQTTASRFLEGLRKGPTSAWVFQTLLAGVTG